MGWAKHKSRNRFFLYLSPSVNTPTHTHTHKHTLLQSWLTWYLAAWVRHLPRQSCSPLTMCLDTVKPETVQLLLTDVRLHFVFLCGAQVRMYVCVCVCVCVCVWREDCPYRLSLLLYPLLASHCILKIFCQAHSFVNNSARSRSSFRVQTALGAHSAANECQQTKNTQSLLNTLLCQFLVLFNYPSLWPLPIKMHLFYKYILVLLSVRYKCEFATNSVCDWKNELPPELLQIILTLYDMIWGTIFTRASYALLFSHIKCWWKGTSSGWR